MGCFDSTCAVSGLPIKFGDPICFAIVEESPSFRTFPPHNEFRLWTPLTTGEYDDYGSVTMESIDPDSPFFTVIDLMSPYLTDDKGVKLGLPPKSNNKKRTAYYEKVLECLYYGMKYVPPSQDFSKTPNLQMYMVHEWAYEFLSSVELHEEDIYKNPLEAIFNQIDSEAKRTSGKEKSTSELIEEIKEQSQRIRELIGSMNKLSFVHGEWGHITPKLIDLLTENAKIVSPHREKWIPLFESSLIFAHNHFRIRKILSPAINVGEQHDDYEVLGPWTSVVAKYADGEYKSCLHEE